MTLVLQYSTGVAWQSEVIRRMCHSPFSHVDIVLEGEGLLGASGPDKTAKMISPGGGMVIPDEGGVRVRPFDPWPYKERPRRLTIRSNDPTDDFLHARIIELARAQIGKPFDDGALYDFLSSHPGDRDWRSQDKWFCSELVVWCCETCGLFPWSLISPKNRVTPADSIMLFNPLVSSADIADFVGGAA